MKESYDRRMFRSNMDMLLSQPDAELVRRESQELYAALTAADRQMDLPLTRAALAAGSNVVNGSGALQRRLDRKGCWEWWHHALAGAQGLLDLDLPLPAPALDRILAAALCHMLPEVLLLSSPREELPELFPLPDEVWKAVMLVTGDSGRTEAERHAYFNAILNDRNALLAKLALRGDVVSRLSRLPLEESMRLARETRQYFLPLCIRARDLYPELSGVFGTMIGKLRCLVAVADVLDRRFAGQEKELEAEILDLEEDNSRLRRILMTLEAENG